MNERRPMALAVEDQFVLSQLLLGAPCDAAPEQLTRLFIEGWIERRGKRWALTQAGRELLVGEATQEKGPSPFLAASAAYVRTHLTHPLDAVRPTREVDRFPVQTPDARPPPR